MESIHEAPPSRSAWPIPAAESALAVVSLATAGIHFAVMGDHFQEYVAFGVFFAVVAWFQGLWALGVVMAPTRSLLLTGAIVNAIVVLVWLVSRTIGLPIGPDPGIAEPAAFLDLLSTLLEVALVVTISLLLIRGRPRRERNARRGLILVGVLALTLITLTTVAVASVGEEGHGQGDDPAAVSDDLGLTTIPLGQGRELRALVEGSGGTTRIHLTFFAADGSALDVRTVSVTGVSPSGSEVPIPVQRFEPGHYAASTDLAPGDWEFHVEAATTDGDRSEAHIAASVP